MRSAATGTASPKGQAPQPSATAGEFCYNLRTVRYRLSQDMQMLASYRYGSSADIKATNVSIVPIHDVSRYVP